MKKSTHTLIVFLMVISLFGTTLPVLAGDPTFGLDETAKAADIKITDDPNPFPEMIGDIIGWFLGILGVIFFVFIVMGGFAWMMAGGNEEKIMQAKGKILNAIYGLIIIFISYALAGAVVEALTGATGTG